MNAKAGVETVWQGRANTETAFMYSSVKTVFCRFDVGVCSTRITFQMDVEICILQSAVVPGY